MAVRLTLVYADYNKTERFTFDIEEPAASLVMENAHRQMRGADDQYEILRFPLSNGGEALVKIGDVTYMTVEPIPFRVELE